MKVAMVRNGKKQDNPSARFETDFLVSKTIKELCLIS